MFDRLLDKVEKLSAERPVLLTFLVFLLAAVIIIPLSVPFFLAYPDEFVVNVMSEAYGTLFDLLIIGWLLLWLNKMAERRRQKNRYREEIEDVLGWQSPEATHRIASNVRRLNRIGVSREIHLTEAYLREASLEGAQLIEADLWGSNLESAKLREVNLEGANLAGASLEEADLESANVKSADLRGASLRAADLERSNLEEANLGGVDLTGADLQYSSLKRASLRRATLDGINLRGADLEGANLKGADLNDANLMDANLRQVNLENANLRKAYLERADLQLAQFDGANLERADLKGTGLPKGDDLSVFENVASLFGAQFDSDVEIELKELYPHLFEQSESVEVTPTPQNQSPDELAKTENP